MGKLLHEKRAPRFGRSPPLQPQAGDRRTNPRRDYHPGDIAAAGPDPKRYVWKAEGQEILRKSQRAKDALDKVSKKKEF